MKNWLKKHYAIITITFTALTLSVIAIYYYTTTFPIGPTDDHKAWGEFGSYLGGVLGSIFGISGFFALLYTIGQQNKALIQQSEALRQTDVALKQQKLDLDLSREELALTRNELRSSAESLKLQKEIMDIQKFETTFYNLLDKYLKITKEFIDGNKLVNVNTYFYLCDVDIKMDIEAPFLNNNDVIYKLSHSYRNTSKQVFENIKTKVVEIISTSNGNSDTFELMVDKVRQSYIDDIFRTDPYILEIIRRFECILDFIETKAKDKEIYSRIISSFNIQSIIKAIGIIATIDENLELKIKIENLGLLKFTKSEYLKRNYSEKAFV